MDTHGLDTGWDLPFLGGGAGGLPLPWTLSDLSLSKQNLTLWEFGRDPVGSRGYW